MSFEKIDPEERKRVERDDPLVTHQFADMIESLLRGNMVWSNQWRAAMSISQWMRRRGWKLHYKEAYRDGVRGRYFWAERKEPKP